MLAARAGRAIGIDPQILVLDFDLDGVVDHGIGADRGEAGVTTRACIERRDSHQPVDAAFGLQPAIGVVARNLDAGRLDAGFLAGAFFHPFDLIAVRLGPARVHAQQHLRPVLGFRAAGTGMDFEIAVIAVGFAR